MDNLAKILNNAVINIVPSQVRYWMIRTNSGVFYDEFIKNRYVALGWNVITKDESLDKDSREGIKEIVEERYLGNPNTIINKCHRFISEINNNDILIIPSRGTDKITFAYAGEYYEERKYTLDDEKNVLIDIENAKNNNFQIECPYVKRRKIEIIKTVYGDKVSSTLLRGLTNYHGISNVSKYKQYILEEMFETYIDSDRVSIQIGINTHNDINVKVLVNLITVINNYLEEYVGLSEMSITLNLHSPGKFSLVKKNKKNEDDNKEDESIEKLAKKFFDKMSKKSSICLLLLVCATGGKFGPIELNGIPNAMVKILSIDSEVEKSKLEVKEKEESIEKIKLDNLQHKIDIYKSLSEKDEEESIDYDKISSKLKEIIDLGKELDLGEN